MPWTSAWSALRSGKSRPNTRIRRTPRRASRRRSAPAARAIGETCRCRRTRRYRRRTCKPSRAGCCSRSRSKRDPRLRGGDNSGRAGRLEDARDRHHEVLAHHVLAGDHFLGFAALFVEHHRGELLQRLARFVQGAAMRVHTGQFLDEADVAVIRLEVYSGERKPSLFHSRLRGDRTRLRDQACRSMTFGKKNAPDSYFKTNVVGTTTKKFCAAQIAAALLIFLILFVANASSFFLSPTRPRRRARACAR